MQRVALFVATNLAVVAVLAIALHAFGVQGLLDARGVGLDVDALLAFSLVFGMGGSFVSLALSKWLAKRATGARVIDAPADAREAWLVETVRQQARAAGIAPPEVAVYPAHEPNAFATGARRDHALVAVSEGLLRDLRREEVEAVLAHEVSHVANGDMVTLALVQGVVNAFVIGASRVVGHVVDRVVLRNEQGYGPGYLVTTLAAQVVFGLLAAPIVFWFSRRREFRADAGAAGLVGPRPMIAALARLRATAPGALPQGMAALGIDAPRGLARWWSTHPSLDERIAALRAHARHG